MQPQPTKQEKPKQPTVGQPTEPTQNSSQPQPKVEEQKQSEEDKATKFFNERLKLVYDEHYLSEFQRAAMGQFIQKNMADRKNDKMERARAWLLNKINGKKYTSTHEWQKGCSEVVPGLRATPWWDTKEFPWVKPFEECYQTIKQELLALRNEKGFQPYRGPSWMTQLKAKDGVGSQSHDSGNWNVYYLMLHDMKFDKNCEKVPKTMELIEKYIPRNYHHCFFSAVTKGTHIIKHHGPTNKKLRFHMPLIGAKGSRLRVADQTRQQQVGKCYVFDDSFEHEAWHDGEETRFILIIDFWHPDLTDQEVKFFNFMQSAKMKTEKKLSEHDPEKDNFYSVIETARGLLDSNDWWVSNEHKDQQGEVVKEKGGEVPEEKVQEVKKKQENIQEQKVEVAVQGQE